MPDFVCSNTVTASLGQNLPVGGSVVWSVSNNLSIIGSNTSPSVSFTRASNMSGTGTVTASVTYNNITITVSKAIAIYPTLVNGMYSSVPFVVDGVPIGPLPTTLPIQTGVETTISWTLPNAAQAGVIEMEWLSRCGAITSGPIHTWNGNDLTSTITVLFTEGGNCNNMNVRPINPCGIGQWRSQACTPVSNMSLLVVPNPAMFSLTASIDTEYDIPAEGWRYTIVDRVGNIHQVGKVFSALDQINTERLPNGMYKLIIYGDEVVNASFSIVK